MLVSYQNTTWCHDPEDLDLKHCHHKGLKTHIQQEVLGRFPLNVSIYKVRPEEL